MGKLWSCIAGWVEGEKVRCHFFFFGCHPERFPSFTHSMWLPYLMTPTTALPDATVKWLHGSLSRTQNASRIGEALGGLIEIQTCRPKPPTVSKPLKFCLSPIRSSQVLGVPPPPLGPNPPPHSLSLIAHLLELMLGKGRLLRRLASLGQNYSLTTLLDLESFD